MNLTMHAAVVAFEKIRPARAQIDPKRDKPIYTLVKIDGWPYDVHYEFRSEQERLCVEMHIEDKRYAHLGETLRACAENVHAIHGFALEYHHCRTGRHHKMWPSLSIRLPAAADGKTAAAVMQELIAATEPQVTRALGHH